MRLSLFSPQSEMVIYEAAHAIVNMKRTTSRELAPAVSVLQLFCSSQKPTLRFAAVRTLNKAGLDKNTGFCKKIQSSGFFVFWVFLFFFVFFCFFYIFAQKREFLGFFQFQEYTFRCIQTINYNHSY
jgi:hypothetical protein